MRENNSDPSWASAVFKSFSLTSGHPSSFELETHVFGKIRTVDLFVVPGFQAFVLSRSWRDVALQGWGYEFFPEDFHQHLLNPASREPD